jgi:hypothetical protein
VGHWIPAIEDYFRTAPDVDYIRLAFYYLEGGSRALWTNVYEAYKRANGGAEPPNPRRFFRQTLEAVGREEKGFRQCRSQGLRSLQQAQVRDSGKMSS